MKARPRGEYPSASEAGRTRRGPAWRAEDATAEIRVFDIPQVHQYFPFRRKRAFKIPNPDQRSSPIITTHPSGRTQQWQRIVESFI